MRESVSLPSSASASQDLYLHKVAPTFSLCRRIFFTYLAPQKRKIILAFICMAFAGIATGATAKLMEPIVNDIFIDKNKTLLIPIALGILGAFVVKGVAIYGESVTMGWLGQRLITNLQKDLFKSLLRADMSFYHAHPSGELISRCVSDVSLMRQLVHFILTSAGKYFVTLLALVSVMFWQDWLLAIISFFVFPVAILPIARIGRRMRKVTFNTQHEVARLMSYLSQVFLGARIVRSYNMEKYEQGRLGQLAENIMQLTYKASKVRSWGSPVMETLGGVAIMTVVIYGGFQVMSGGRTPGQLFSFITALLLAYDPMKRLATLNANLQEGLAAADRVFTMMDIKPTIVDQPHAKEMKPLARYLTLRNVSYTYPTMLVPAVKDVSMTLERGKTYALVGGSGAGKSTLLNLLLRFYDISAGGIYFDDQEIRDVTIESLRNAIALVSQEVMLFDDTIEANIRYGRPDASIDEIHEAAMAAAAHDFILELPQGYATVVGEQGVRLSGGQRQRVAIARAILKNAPILLLDEATSALDNQSERLVQAALERLKEGRTCLVVAHRLSTVQNADCLFVMDQGRLVESGTHEELLAQNGAYAAFYALQFEGN